MRFIFVSLISAIYMKHCTSAPTRTLMNIPLFAARATIPPGMFPYQSRGPFDFIGNWIQSSDWFPIEINVPDTITNIGTGVGSFATNVGSGFNSFAQNVGSGFQAFTQNLGNGFQSFTQNLSQRFPVLAVIVRPNSPPRYFLLVPTQNMNDANEKKYHDNKHDINFNPFDGDILDSFP